MFQLLYTANYKTELFYYWKTLSEGGSLSNPGSIDKGVIDCVIAEQFHADNSSQSQQVTVFDLVREYNKSLEDWCHQSRPQIKQLIPVIVLVY